MHSSSSEPAGGTPAPDTAADAVMGLMMAFGRRIRQRQPGDPVDFSAFPILKLLSHQGPMRLSGLAQQIGLDASTVSRHARQLEDRGLLERTSDPDDGRASRVAVSAAGEVCLRQGLETRRNLISHALAHWSTADEDTLRTLLHRLVEDLQRAEHPDVTDPPDQPRNPDRPDQPGQPDPRPQRTTA